MIDLKALWKDEKAAAVVCSTKGTTKNMVLNAVIEGAKDFDAVAAKVPLCCDCGCASGNASGRPCRENVEALLAVYLPVFDMMMEDGGCERHRKPQKPSGCTGTRTDACGSCTGCK